jgi:hypothetical protein
MNRNIQPSIQFLNTYQVSKYIGRSPGAIRNLVMRRKIPFRKVAGRLVFFKDEIDAWIFGSPGVSWDDIKKA